ncbi:MAG: hypothetical protein AB7I18_11855 [Candidatus Berkiella sp.]
MTFKHVKFEDSPIMRSLEKVAREKGLVKDEPIAKTASAPTIDLAPSGNLMSNVLKLCAGLRASGFDKYASELELAYLNYKRANTLYETSKEKGEDLVDEAHPKGSHKLEGVDGDAVIETILDNHLKMVELVNKKPTGKLASSKDVMGAVKKVLAQDAPKLSREQIENYVLKYIVERARQIKDTTARAAFDLALQHLDQKSGLVMQSEADDMREAYQKVTNTWYKMVPNAPTVSLLIEMNTAYQECINQADIDNSRIKGQVIQGFRAAISATQALQTQLQTFEDNPTVIPEGIPQPQVAKPKDVSVKGQFNARLTALNAELKRAEGVIANKVPQQYQDKAKGHIANWRAQAKVESEYINDPTTTEDQLNAKKDEIGKRISNLEGWLGDFKTNWLGEK